MADDSVHFEITPKVDATPVVGDDGIIRIANEV
jgi:hypothetical protein